jgi:hypothetical protein
VLVCTKAVVLKVDVQDTRRLPRLLSGIQRENTRNFMFSILLI